MLRDRWERLLKMLKIKILLVRNYEDSSNLGVQFNRFQNRQNGTFLYARPAETEAINSNPNLSASFIDQGVAFASLV